MTWLIIPALAFIIMLCVVVKGNTDEQAKRAEMEYRKTAWEQFHSRRTS